MLRNKMISFMTLLIAVMTSVLFLSSCSNDSGTKGTDLDDPIGGIITIAPSASRSSGVAPLGVVFTAGFTSSSGTQRAFHDLEYSWDFDDPTADVWATTGLSKNTDKGAVAAHVFEKAGTYTVTVTVKNESGATTIEDFTINVTDPTDEFSGTQTICLSDMDSSGEVNNGCPVGAQTHSTDDITAINTYIASGNRILLHRGSSWTLSSGYISIEDVTGPLVIGAYGNCGVQDSRGICSNAPLIHSTSTESPLFDITRSSDIRIQDLHLTGAAGSVAPIQGATDIDKLLLIRLKTENVYSAVSIGYYDTDGHDQVMMVDNDISSSVDGLWIGSERLVVMGNLLKDSDISHVLRIWQSYLGVICHNDISGSGLKTEGGRHLIKLHGPSQAVLSSTGTERLSNPTRFVVISDNIIGSSDAWSVTVMPQGDYYDERLSDILIEKNCFFTGYGTQIVSKDLWVALSIAARSVTVRNNVFYGTGSSPTYYNGISVYQRGVEPAPTGVHLYNNTFYKSDDATIIWGIEIRATASQTVVKNNFAHFPSGAIFIQNESADLIDENNHMTTDARLVNPDASPDYLQKDFKLQADSPARGAGTTVPVFDDFLGNERIQGTNFDLGAFKY